LNRIWIYAVAVCKCYHFSIILSLLNNKQALNVNLRGIVSVSEAERSSAWALAKRGVSLAHTP
jgi:hypothetical protein